MHLVWLLGFMGLSGIANLYLIWMRRPFELRNLWLSAAWQSCNLGGFWIAYLLVSHYDGAITVPEIHTHIFGGSVNFALEYFGREKVEQILGPDVVIAHGNGLKPEEVEIIGETQSNVATAPSTAENMWYGYPPIPELLDAGANVTITRANFMTAFQAAWQAY